MRKIKIRFVVCWVLLAFFCPAYSASVSATDVQRVFENWSSQSPYFKGKQTPFVRKSYSVNTLKKRRFDPSSMPFYVVELEPEGFVIMNSDNRLPPVLAYSDSGTLNLDDLPENAFRTLLSRSMTRSSQKLLNLSPSVFLLDLFQSSLEGTANAAEWEMLTSESDATEEPIVYGMNGVTNGPFLTTIWSQTRHYNKLCPETPDAYYGYDGRVPAGCVAIAATQIMNYYEWPYRGVGSHSYTDNLGDITGSHSVDFSDPYDWDNMLDTYRYWTSEPTAAVEAVSELIYEVGVAVDMDYDSEGSGAYTSDLNTMMPQAFFYDEGTYLYVPGSSQGVADQIRTDMLASRPAVVTISGHAIVADGHVDDGVDEYFHINYGWGNHTNNSWYLIDDIAGDPAVGCISGLYPSLVPLNKTEGGQTNTTSGILLEWAIADVRTADVQSVSVLRHVLQTNTFADVAGDFLNFSDTSTSTYKDWAISGSGYSGDCFYKEPGGYSNHDYHLTSCDQFIPQGGAELRFWLKTHLSRDIFRVMISTDDGQTFSQVGAYDPGTTWTQITVDLSSYAGSGILIRFEYVYGSYYPSSGGVWLDEISFSGGGWYDWETLQVSESMTGTVVSNLTVGTHTFALQAFDGASFGAISPEFTVVVDGDIDNDGLPNEWESLYFGGDTNANPEALASNGVNTLLEAYIAGINPTNPASLFQASLTNASGFVVRWNATSGRVYSVLGSTDLLDGFQPLETNILWPQASWTDNVPRVESFYRIDVQLAD